MLNERYRPDQPLTDSIKPIRMKFVAISFLCCLLLTGCYRTSQPTDEPELVRIGQDRAFIVPPPYNSPTRPHWLTGKDQVPRFPAADIDSIPPGYLDFGLRVSEILNRPDLKDGSQFSKDVVVVSVASIGYARPGDLGEETMERYRSSGKTPHHRNDWTCYYRTPEKDEECFISMGSENLIIRLGYSGKFPNPQYDVSFDSNIHGRLTIQWRTSERNLPYWQEIQKNIMQKLISWRYTKT